MGADGMDSRLSASIRVIRGQISPVAANGCIKHDGARGTPYRLPRLVSQESILRDGQWLDVPDSRTW